MFRNWLTRLTDFTGRTPRKQYWFVVFCAMLAVLLVQTTAIWLFGLDEVLQETATDADLFTAPSILIFDLPLLMFSLLTLGTCARRFHDVGWSGKWFKWMFFLVILTFPLVLLKSFFGVEFDMAVLSLAIVPYASIVWTAWIGVMPSQKGANTHGEHPYVPNEGVFA